MNRSILVACSAIGICVVMAACSRAPSTPAQPLDAIRQGKPVSIMALYEDEQSFQYVMDRIAEGSDEWLDVAARLAPTADAHPGEELANALALALTNAPEAVLSRTSGPITLGQVCYGPSEIEDETQYREALLRSISAVSKVNNAKLVTKRDECLKMLKEALAKHPSD